MDVKNSIRQIFPAKNVVIVGDIVADQFLYGTISRVSREAPVFILRHENTNTLPGAAANAAANVASLGGNAILIGMVGDDAEAKLLNDSLARFGVSCECVTLQPSWKTTTKTRVVAGQSYAPRQQVIRIDYENSGPVSELVQTELRRRLEAAADSADAIIVSDYNYGAVFPEIFEDARSISERRQIPLVVDSRYRLGQFTGATTATPNREEVEQILGANFRVEDGDRLRADLGVQVLLVTLGSDGMMLFESGKPPLKMAAVGPTEPVDVTGAGDTVIASYALGLASGMSFENAAFVANHAGGVAVMKKGTAAVSAEELLNSITNANEQLASKQVR